MLLFIFIREEYLTEEANFNTSHVTVYQKDWTAKVADSTISIHLMLLFIFLLISIGQWLCNFNTSHVTVYLKRNIIMTPHCLFQYISCYCLSLFQLHYKLDNVISIHLMLLFIATETDERIFFQIFQYISCYCLSKLPRNTVWC